jgi:hypothetical protein
MTVRMMRSQGLEHEDLSTRTWAQGLGHKDLGIMLSIFENASLLRKTVARFFPRCRGAGLHPVQSQPRFNSLLYRMTYPKSRQLFWMMF